MKLLSNKFSGIIIGGLYGYFGRLVFAALKDSLFKFSLFSVTFIVIVPLLIGSIPILFSSQDEKVTVWYSVWAPSVSVLVFFVLTFMSRVEDGICIVILAVPYVLGAMLGGVLIRFFVMKKRRKNSLVVSLLIIPLMSSVFESRLATPSQTLSFTNKVTINAPAHKIWPNIIRVTDISVDEYDKGLFYYAGVPRPLYAELDKDTTGATRIGHFEGGLRFIEKVSVWERNRKILFDISVDDSSIGSSVFDNHILKGGHFRFISACYELKPVGENKTELSLTSSYELDTKVNGYAAWWGQTLMNDFQGRLLMVLKNRCDQLQN